MMLLHVSTLSFHLQGARIHYLAKLHKFIVPGKHDSNINIQIVYTATTQIDFVRIVTVMILPNFISNWYSKIT